MSVAYNVIKDFGVNVGTDSVSSSPNWVLCVLRLKYPITYKRKDERSRSKIFTEAVELRGKPLIITDDCVQLQVTGSKSNYVMTLGATLLESGVNYLSEIYPGDYLLAWMVNNDQDYASLLERLGKLSDQGGQACNGFLDGMKFCGRVQSVHKQLQQQAEGQRTVRYTLQGVSFTEFDAQIFYDPYLAERPDIKNDISTYFAKLGVSLNELIRAEGKSQGNGIDVNRALPFFLDLLLGRGVPPSLGLSIEDERTRNTTGLDAEGSYIVPTAVGQLLGKTKSSSNFFRYADLLECVIGIQKYEKFTVSDDLRELGKKEGVDVDEQQIAKNFQPKGTLGGGSKRFCGDMLGDFLPQAPHFTNKTVWSVLQQYLNPACNEMFTCLRVNPDGNVVPTFVARQLPFSSPLFKQGTGKSLEHTEFMELPRWGVDSALVKSVDIGRSDALRFNFIHVYGDTVQAQRGFTEQIVENPPIRDDLDVARSGLRSYMMTVACSIKDTRDGSPKKWMSLLGDILMGQHLTVTGIMQTFGIQAPICPGDNIEWDDMVLHIESVTHNCSIDAMGKKTFLSTMSLSHGVRADPADAQSDVEDLNLYAGVLDEDQRTYDPGLMVDNAAPKVTEEDKAADSPMKSTNLPITASVGEGVLT